MVLFSSYKNISIYGKSYAHHWYTLHADPCSSIRTFRMTYGVLAKGRGLCTAPLPLLIFSDFCVFSCHSTKMLSIVSTRGFIKAHLSGVKSVVRPVRCISHCKTVILKMGYGATAPPPPPYYFDLARTLADLPLATPNTTVYDLGRVINLCPNPLVTWIGSVTIVLKALLTAETSRLWLWVSARHTAFFM